MRKLAIIFCFLCMCLGSERTGNAQLIPMGTFQPPVNSIEGMAFDPNTGNLWMVEPSGNTLFEVDTTGSLISTVTPAVAPLEGLHVLPNGNLLAVNSSGLVQELTPDGAIAPNGISLNIGAVVSDPEGVTFDATSNTVFVAAQNDQAIFEFNLVGSLLNTIPLSPNHAQGITIDPSTGHVFFSHSNSNEMFELDSSGTIIQQFDLAAAFSDFDQPDALTMDPSTKTFYAGSDSDGQVIVFRIEAVPHDVVVPNSFLATRGSFVSGSVVELAESDDLDLSIRRSNADIQSRTEFEVKAVSPTASPSSLEVTLEGAVFARSQVNQTIELFDYVAVNWEQVDTRAATRFTDSTVTVAATGDLSRFVESGTMCIKARIRYQSPVARQRFASNTDQFVWTIGQ